ncbi:MAG: hypothetical protein IJN80_00020 [Clostridia bacterium]|nr:hypothetical protein [Clostridia bacterium]
MKRFTAILLAMVLLLCGCSVEWEDTAAPDTAVENQPQGEKEEPSKEQADDREIDPAIEAGYTGPEDRMARVVLYGGKAFYECDPYKRDPWQPHIYAVPLDGSEKPKDLLKGELIALYDFLLLGKTDTHYCALDLSKEGAKWIELQSAADEGFHFSFDKKIILFHSSAGENFVDTVDLKTLQSKRTKINANVTAAAVIKDAIYYMVAEEENTVLYTAKIENPKEKFLRELSGEWEMGASEDRLFLYKDSENPLVYDTNSGVFKEPMDFSKVTLYPMDGPFFDIINGVVRACYWRGFDKIFWYYDIASEKEVTDDYRWANGLPAVERGYWEYDTEAEDCEFYIDETPYVLHLGEDWIYSRIMAANPQGMANLGNTYITVGDFSTGKCNRFIHSEQEVATE